MVRAAHDELALQVEPWSLRVFYTNAKAAPDELRDRPMVEALTAA